MKRTLVLGLGCFGGVLAGRLFERSRRSDGATVPAMASVGSIAAATGIAGRAADALGVDSDDLVKAFGVGFVTGAILTTFARPVSRALGMSVIR